MIGEVDAIFLLMNSIRMEYMNTKKLSTSISNLELNTNQLKDMGGEYIFSAVEIKNYLENSLKFEKVFKNEKSLWRIYLYKVK